MHRSFSRISTRSLLVAAVSVVVAAGSQANAQATGDLNLNQPGGYAATSIVQPISAAVEVTRLYPAVPNAVSRFLLQRVEVLDSLTLPKLAQLNALLYVGKNGDAGSALQAGKTYLIIGSRVEGGKLLMQQGDGTTTCQAEEGDDITVKNWFHTNKAQLAIASNESEVITKSLLDCFVGAARHDAAMLADFLSYIGYPGMTKSAMTSGTKSNTYSAYARVIAAKCEPEVACRVLWINNVWRIHGSADEYLKAVVTNALKPDFFANGDLGAIRFWESHLKPAFPKGFPHELPNPNDWVDAVVGTKSRFVREFLLENDKTYVGGMYPLDNKRVVPDRAHELKLIPLLDHEDPSVRFGVAKHFALALVQPSGHPLRVRPPNFRGDEWEYPDLAEKVTFWKAYWKDH